MTFSETIMVCVYMYICMLHIYVTYMYMPYTYGTYMAFYVPQAVKKVWGNRDD